MKYYFDESGDAGSLNKNSNTTNFSMCIYKETDPEITKDFINKLRNKFKIDRKELKWYRFSKNMRTEFKRFKHILDDNIYTLNIIKKNINAFGEYLFIDTIQSLIINNNINGEIFYDGDHLTRTLHKVKLLLKVKNIKVKFVNKSSSDMLGIQIADIYAGYIRREN